MFIPDGPVIRALQANLVVNRIISSLYSVFDPHIPETSHLEGAENIVLPAIGHFRPIARSRHAADGRRDHRPVDHRPLVLTAHDRPSHIGSGKGADRRASMFTTGYW